MPKILLCPVTSNSTLPGVPVGRVGVGTLASLRGVPPRAGPILSIEGRQPYIDGHAVQFQDISEELLQAVIHAAASLFGDLWLGPMVQVTGLGQRTLQRDRIAKHGLPVHVLVMLGRGSFAAPPKAFGHLLLSVATIWDDVGKSDPFHQDGSDALSSQGLDELADRLHGLVEHARLTVNTLRDEAETARQIRRSLETNR